jgi:hypothetical protein
MSSVMPTQKKKSLKVEIIKEITEKLMEKLQDIVNQKLQDALKKFQNIKKKNLRRHGNN